MQRAAAASSSSLRRLVAEAFNRPPILSRAASLVATTFSRPLAASDRHRQLTLLDPIYHPCRGYATRDDMLPSDMEDDDEEDDEIDDDYVDEKDSEEDDDLNSDEDMDDLGNKSEMSD